MIPTKIGRYEIKSELGRGGMATVYHGYDPSFEREVAIKVLPQEFLHDPNFYERFKREIKIVAALEHPAIVPVYDVGEENGIPYFVMRFMAGGSLSNQIEKGKFSIQDATKIIERLASALGYAHRKGVIHRDIKPDNILFDANGDPYISDFGVASLDSGPTNITGTAAIGTPAYMSPEQAQGEKVDSRSDIYGLGVIIFQMLSGELPYKADTPMGVAVKHITDPVPEILKVNPSLPKATDTVIKTAMAKDREKRYPTVSDLSTAFHELAQSGNGAASHVRNQDTPASAAPKPGPSIGNNRNLIFAGIGIVGVMAILAIVLLSISILKGRTPATPLATTEAAGSTIETATGPTANPDFFTEDFDGNLDNWMNFITGGIASQMISGIDKGYMNFQFQGKELHYYTTYTSRTYGDVRIDLKAENRSDNNTSVTLICRFDEQKGWYDFTITNSGLYKINYTKWNSDKQNVNSTVIADGASALVKGGKDVNEYTAICSGRTLSLWINGNEIRTVDDNHFVLDDGYVGFGASSLNRIPSEVRIDSFSVSQP